MTAVTESGRNEGREKGGEERRAGRPGLSRHPLRAEAVRGIGPWAGGAVLVALTFALAVDSERWQGGWAETRDQLHTAAGLLGVPLALAAGCWQGGRERRRGTRELLATTARGPLARLLASALPTALWVVLGYAAATVLALSATCFYAMGDTPYLVTPLLDAVVLTAACVAGQVVGRLVGLRLAAPVLGVVAYGVLAGLTGLRSDEWGGLRYLSPVTDSTTDAVTVWWQPVAMTVWAAGLASAAALGYAARRRALALLPLAAAVAAGTLLVQTADGMWHTNPVARRQVCDTSTTPQICVNARYESLLPQVTDALSGLTGRLEGVQNLPVRFEDRPGRPGRDEVALPMITPLGQSVVRGELTDPRGYAWAAGMMLYGRGECDTEAARLDAVDDAVQHYLAPSPWEKESDRQLAAGDAADRATLEARRTARARLTAMDEEQRRTWLSAYFATTDSCDGNGVPTL